MKSTKKTGFWDCLYSWAGF